MVIVKRDIILQLIYENELNFTKKCGCWFLNHVKCKSYWENEPFKSRGYSKVWYTGYCTTWVFLQPSVVFKYAVKGLEVSFDKSNFHTTS